MLPAASSVIWVSCLLLCGIGRAASPELKASGPALGSVEEAELDATFTLAREAMEGLRPLLKELEGLRTSYIEDPDLNALERRRAKLLEDIRPSWQRFLASRKLFSEAKAAEQRSKFAVAFQGFMADRSIPADAPKQFRRANGILAFDQDLRSFKDWGENVIATEASAFEAARKAYRSRRRTVAAAAGFAAALLLAALALWRRRARGAVPALLLLAFAGVPAFAEGIETIGWSDRLPLLIAFFVALALPLGLALYSRRKTPPSPASPSKEAPAPENTPPQERTPAESGPAPLKAEAPAASGLLAGKYERRGLASSGSSYEIWDAFDRSEDRNVVVRILRFGPTPADMVRRANVLKEARTLAAFRHPAAQPLLDVVEGRSSVYLVIEPPMEGKTLAQLLSGGAKLSLGRACRFLSAPCDALDAAHMAGIVHGGVTPSRILATDKGEVQVLDFGSWNGGRPTGEGSPSRAGDIRSMGLCLREMLETGLSPAAEEFLQAALDPTGTGITSMSEFKAKLTGISELAEE